MKILLSAGPTREPLDAVRYLSNRSSGRMGVAIAREAIAQGHEVCVVHGPLSVHRLTAGEWIPVEPAEEMLTQLRSKMPWCDALIMAAAVSDFRPRETKEGKADKDDLATLELEKNPDIAATLAGEFPHKHKIVFSLENTLDPQRPLRKMRSKGADWVIYNQLKSMGADSSSFGIMNTMGEHILPLRECPKDHFARLLIAELEKVSPQS